MAAASHIIIRKRITGLVLCATIVMVGLVGRLAYLQFFKSAWLLENAFEQRVRDIPVEARRGVIYDRNGQELAVSQSADSLYVIPSEIQDARGTAHQLAAILSLDEEKLTKKLKQRQAFTWIKRKITAEQAQTIKQTELPGIGLTQESQRYYPNDHLAAHVLGFTGIDSQGLDGVELTFDHYLKGKSGKISIEYDAGGREIPGSTHKYVAAEEGNSIYLTIDKVIQMIAERELERAMAETQSRSGTVLAVNPKTGEILALANRPDYNPNCFGTFDAKLWRNLAVANVYEPGSTFKIVTASAGLQEKVVHVEDRFYDPGYIEVQGRRIRCWKDGGHGSESFAEVVKNSCNPGFITVGLRLGRDPFYDYVEKFGFGRPSGIDLPGEAKGLMIQRGNAKPINIATMAMGQSIAVTPVQMVMMAATVANGGVLLRPQLVREVRNKDHQVLQTFTPQPVQQVITPETAVTLKGLLQLVVDEGSGKGAAVEGYHIGGKTGTAQKVGSHGYEAGRYVASFVGFAPVEDPQITMIVILDEPQGLFYGGQIAAPLFGAIMKDVLPYLKVKPYMTGLATNKTEQPIYVTVPEFSSLTVYEAQRIANQVGLTLRCDQDSGIVSRQVPSVGTTVEKGTQVILYLH